MKVYLFSKVPLGFFEKTHFCGKKIANVVYEETYESDMKTHCEKFNDKCKTILNFLKLDGKSLFNTNLQILREDSLKFAINVFAQNFDSLIDKVIYPVYEKRFLIRHQFLQTKSNARNSSLYELHERNTKQTKAETTIFIDGLVKTIRRLFNIFYVLNCESSTDNPYFMHKWEKDIGTSLANLNFLLDTDYENNWYRFKKESTIRPQSQTQMTYAGVATENLQKQLRATFSNLFLTSRISVTDIIGLLGYANNFEIENLDFSKCTKRYGRMKKECILKSAMKINHKLHPIHGFDPFHPEKNVCDLDLLLQSWIHNDKGLTFMKSKYHKKFTKRYQITADIA